MFLKWRGEEKDWTLAAILSAQLHYPAKFYKGLTFKIERPPLHMVWPAIISPLKHQTEAHLTLIKHPCVEEGGGGSILDYSLNKYYCMNFDCIHSWDRQSEARQSYQRLTPLPNRQENRPGYNPTETTHNSTATTQTGTFHSNKSCVLVWIKKEIRDIN